MASRGGQQGDSANNPEGRQQTVTIDPDGDLILIVGSNKTRFLVCSKTLSRSAAFWKRCLYGPFREAKPADGQDWVVKFPEDNPSAMRYVLLLAHALGNKLPEITLQLAFEVTVLTNKYNMTRLLWAVARSWLEDDMPMKVDHTIVSELQWIWVTKELGDINKYTRSLARLSQLVSTTADENGVLLLKRHFRPDNGKALTRQSLKGYDAEKDVILIIADEVKSARKDALQNVQYLLTKEIWILRHTIKSFDSSKGCEGAHICTGRTPNGSLLHPNKRRFCEYAMQAIVTKISAERDSAVKPAATVGISAQTFLANARRFICRIEKEIDLVCGDEHKSCTPFRSKLPSPEKMIEMTSLDCRNQNHRAFEKQARISGLGKVWENDDIGNHGAPGRKRSRDEFEAAESAPGVIVIS